ncbi:MAG: hypothetical protein QXU40_01925 [Candidatus Pacearchaeota archaeon]
MILFMVSGFSFFHNVCDLGYPFIESILSVLPLVDEFIAVVVKSSDETLKKISSIKDKKIKIIEVESYDNLHGVEYYRFYTNLALSHCKGFWRIYIQADEVLVEDGYEIIKSAMKKYESSDKVLGLVLMYRHFYGSPKYYHDSAPWYRWEIRILKYARGISAWRDAQGFRINGKKISVAVIPAYIHHYGWMLPQEYIKRKISRAIKIRYSKEIEIKDVLTQTEGLKIFDGKHPSCMKDFIEKNEWTFEPKIKPLPYKRKIQKLIADITERIFKRRFLEYQNFKIVEYF